MVVLVGKGPTTNVAESKVTARSVLGSVRIVSGDGDVLIVKLASVSVFQKLIEGFSKKHRGLSNIGFTFCTCFWVTVVDIL